MFLQDLEDYNHDDLHRYFVSGKSLIPFVDSNGNDRLARIVGIEDDVLVYRVVLKSLMGLSDIKFRKPVNRFNYTARFNSKYLVDNTGKLYHISPQGIRTNQKSVSTDNMLLTDCTTGHQQNVLASDYSIYYDYFFSDRIVKKRLEVLPRTDCTILTANVAMYNRKLFVFGHPYLNVQTIDQLNNVMEKLNEPY